MSEAVFPDRMSRKRAAMYLGFSKEALKAWASSGKHALPFVKIGRVVFYEKPSLDRWLEAHRGTSNAEISEKLAHFSTEKNQRVAASRIAIEARTLGKELERRIKRSKK